MPRSRNDPLKRKCAQAINHAAAAILDVNAVYEEFETTRKRLEELPKESQLPNHAQQLAKYTEMAEELKTCMMGLYACQQHIVLFIGEAWGLDEESVKVYLR